MDYPVHVATVGRKRAALIAELVHVIISSYGSETLMCPTILGGSGHSQSVVGCNYVLYINPMKCNGHFVLSTHVAYFQHTTTETMEKRWMLRWTLEKR